MRIQRISQTPVPSAQEVDISLIESIIPKYKDKKGGLITLLQEIQTVYTYLPKAALQRVEEELNYPLSELYAVATFYAQFKLKPSGKYSIKVCKGTACHVQNANAVMNALSEHLKVNDGETTEDGKFTLEAVSCLGCCSLAPAIMIGDETFGKLSGETAVKAVINFN
ncbi:MAG: NADH-quinone oxidoreductase subunit NuoE [Bacteroidetes bacterium]|nr:NADH-quinone oxidoreductase subunit NuoE [Bacteroidota bacterium]MCL2301966.1 NADH-quinone oxidoreductase subunit NuoE [Lentimicrobiaceae bacterium]